MNVGLVYTRKKLISQPRCVKVQETVVGRKYITAVSLYCNAANCKCSFRLIVCSPGFATGQNRDKAVSSGTALDS